MSMNTYAKKPTIQLIGIFMLMLFLFSCNKFVNVQPTDGNVVNEFSEGDQGEIGRAHV